MHSFNPLVFLAALGAGGISVIPFAFLQYVHPHGPGLITLQEILGATLTFPAWSYWVLGAVMLIFATLHVLLTILFTKQYISFRATEAYTELKGNPLKNASLVAPLLSYVMTLNVVIGPVRFFVPQLAENLQAVMPIALIVWGLLVVWLLYTEVTLLTTAFATQFDVDKIHFGWLLHPFALAMATVTGTGIAAMAASPDIAHTAAFLSMVTGTMGLFLFVMKLGALFKRQLQAANLPSKELMPSTLIVLPILTLYAISFFRLGHYLEHQLQIGVSPMYYFAVVVGAFAFQTWWLVFGLSLMRGYFSEHYRAREYYPTLWGLICPFVAYAVLASFVYAVFVPTALFAGIAIVSALVAIYFYVDVLYRHILCSRKHDSMNCS